MARTSFKHGEAVTITDASGRTQSGTLHLPDVVMHSTRGQYTLEREEGLGYALYTIARADGSLFRTEGRLS